MDLIHIAYEFCVSCFPRPLCMHARFTRYRPLTLSKPMRVESGQGALQCITLGSTLLCRFRCSVSRRHTYYVVFVVLHQGGTSLCRFHCLTGYSYAVCGSYSMFLACSSWLNFIFISFIS